MMMRHRCRCICMCVRVIMIMRMPVVVTVMIVLVRVSIVTMFFGHELGRRHACTYYAVGRHRRAFKRQASECAAQLLERQPGIEQGSEHHVARRAVETVEVENA